MMQRGIDSKDILISIKEPASFVAEQYRVLYTRLLQFRKERPLKVIGISSAIPGEGKTTVAFNLTITMARVYDTKTLLIEADTRKPSFQQFMKGSNGLGLIQALDDSDCLPTLLRHTLKGRMAILEAGRSKEDTGALFTQGRLKGLIEHVKCNYEFIVMDAPPVLPLAEMNILGEVVDGVLFVVQADRTPRSFVNKALAMLPQEKIIGLVFNNLKTADPFSHYYNYAG